MSTPSGESKELPAIFQTISIQMTPPPDVQRVKSKSSKGDKTDDEDNGYHQLAIISTEAHPDKRSVYIGHNQLWKLKPEEPQMDLRQQDFRKPCQAQMEIITSKTMLEKHILQNQTVSSYPCSVIVCGMDNCGKTTAVKSVITGAVILRDRRQNMTPLLEPSQAANRKCMSCHKAILVGATPNDNVTWLISPPGEKNNAAICLLSYFANKCKIQNQENEYYNLLEFKPPSENLNETFGIDDPNIVHYIQELYNTVFELWERLVNDENIQAAMPTGVSLVNLFDIGPSQASRDFLPFLNQYCNQAVHFACYDKEKDYGSLAIDDEAKSYQSKKCHLLRQLSGIDENKAIILAATKGTVSDHDHDDKLKLIIAKANCISNSENIKHTTSITKQLIEEKVMDCSFQKPLPLRHILLLYIIKCKSKSFLMKRAEIKVISQVFNFKDEDLEDCLKFFCSYGNIFYTHDIPSLKDFVIIDIAQFVEYMHNLYESEENTAQYGLFKQNDDEERNIVLDILVTLKIAVEVKSTQIVLGVQDSCRVYYYIPTARKSCNDSSISPQATDSSGTSQSIHLLSMMGHTKENLQVCLCQHLLNEKCFLIPTTEMNTTAMRFYEKEDEIDIMFVDTGHALYIESMRNDVAMDGKKISMIQRKITPNKSFLMTTQMSKQEIIRMISQNEEPKPEIEMKKVILITKKLSERSDGESRLMKTIYTNDDEKREQEEQLSILSDIERLTCLVYNLYRQYEPQEFKKVLEDLLDDAIP